MVDTEKTINQELAAKSAEIEKSKGPSSAELDEKTNTQIQSLQYELNDVLSRVRELKNVQKQVPVWYEANLSEIVPLAAASKPVPTFSEESCDVPPKEDDNSSAETEPLRDELSRLINARPKIGFLNFFSRHQIKQGYLENLFDQGQDILKRANEAKTVEEQKLQSELEQYEAFIKETAERYAALSKAAEGNDVDAFVTAAKSLVDQPAFSSELAKLLTRPQDTQPSLVDQFFEKIKGDAAKEEALVSKLPEIFESDCRTFMFALQAQNDCKDQDLKRKWERYADTFAGAFFPIDEFDVVNTMRYSRAAYERIGHGDNSRMGLVFRDTSGHGPSFDMSKEQSRLVLAALARRPNYVSIDVNNAVNVMGYSRAGYKWVGHHENKKKMLVFRDSTGNGPTFAASEERASEILKELAQCPTHIAITGEDVVNVMGYARAAYNYTGYGENQRKMLVFRDTRGNGPEFDVTEENAKKILASVAERPTHVAVGEHDVVNVMGYARAGYNYTGYDENRKRMLIFRDTRGYGPNFNVTEVEAKDVLAMLEKCPNYIKIGGNDAVNVRGYSRAAWETCGFGENRSEMLVFRDSNGHGPEFNVTEDKAKGILANIATRPTHVAIGDSNVVNVLGYARSALEFCSTDDTQKKLVFRDPRGNGPKFSLAESEAKKILATLAQLPTCIAIGDENVVNVTGYGRAGYEFGGSVEAQKKHLVFRDPEGNGPRFTASEDQARKFLKDFRDKGRNLTSITLTGVADPSRLTCSTDEDLYWKSFSYFDTSNYDDTLMNTAVTMAVISSFLFSTGPGYDPHINSSHPEAAPFEFSSSESLDGFPSASTNTVTSTTNFEIRPYASLSDVEIKPLAPPELRRSAKSLGGTYPRP